ncbi:MAG: hypothetical protein P1V97_29660 [Planctomycetota bacterium]|nr:hypothetical protein [Planctomycetota bacterium]
MSRELSLLSRGAYISHRYRQLAIAALLLRKKIPGACHPPLQLQRLQTPAFIVNNRFPNQPHRRHCIALFDLRSVENHIKT